MKTTATFDQHATFRGNRPTGQERRSNLKSINNRKKMSHAMLTHGGLY